MKRRIWRRRNGRQVTVYAIALGESDVVPYWPTDLPVPYRLK